MKIAHFIVQGVRIVVSKLVICSVMAIGMAAPAHAASDTFHQLYTVSPGTSVTVHNRNGDVSVHPWNQPKVEVYAEKHAERAEDLQHVSIEVAVGESIEIETVHLVENLQVSVNYRIQVPIGVAVPKVRSSNGNVEMADLQGNVEVKTSNGQVVMNRIAGNVQVDSSNCGIIMQDVEGTVFGDTSNADIQFRNVGGVLGAETSNGSILAEISTMPAEEVKIKTSNGPISLYLSDELNARIEMKTSNGTIAIRHPGIVPQTAAGNTFQGVLGNSGGTLLSVKTSNSAIILERL